MNTERDKFLTEAMGGCWHDFVKDEGTESWDEQTANDTCSFRCTKCEMYEADVQFDEYPKDNPRGWMFYDYNNFSTWEGFGKLWVWASSQVGLLRMITNKLDKNDSYRWTHWVHPDRFADTVYAYLKEFDK